MNTSLVKKASSGLVYLMAFKIFMKIVELSMNILVIRGIDKTEYGLVTYFDFYVKLSLFYATLCLKKSY